MIGFLLGLVVGGAAAWIVVRPRGAGAATATGGAAGAHLLPDPALPEPVNGPKGLIEAARGYRDAFPDLRMTADQSIAEGDYVATRWTGRGTHKGELFGIPATGKEATVTGISIDRWADGKIVESWTNWDTLGLLQQIGAVPAAMQTA